MIGYGMRLGLFTLGVAAWSAGGVMAQATKRTPKAEVRGDSVRTDGEDRVRIIVNGKEMTPEEYARSGRGGDIIINRFGGPGMSFTMARRQRLGVTLNPRAQATDSIGALVDGVTPGGPAATAGIKAGDLITKVDGKSVLTGSVRDHDSDESFPTLRLIELASKLTPGDTVAVEYVRDGARKTVSVVTAKDDGQRRRVMIGSGDFGPERFEMQLDGAPGAGMRRPFAWSYGMGPEDAARMARDLAPRAREIVRDIRIDMGHSLADVEFAAINPDLGKYFGAEEGVLVISAPKESALNVKGGDVILSVDGRKATSPRQLMRILRSYDRGESVKLEVLRNRKKESVTGKLADLGGERKIDLGE